MQFWNDLKISRKIIISIFVISSILTILSVFIAINSINSIELSSLREKGASLAVITAETVKPAVQYHVDEDTDRILSQLVASDGDVSLTAVVIQGPKGQFTLTNNKRAKGYESFNTDRVVNDLKSRAPSQKGATVFLGGENLQFIAVKIDLTANDIHSMIEHILGHLCACSAMDSAVASEAIRAGSIPVRRATLSTMVFINN